MTKTRTKVGGAQCTMRLGARTRSSALEALGYVKRAPPLDLASQEFRECVVWLEDTKIRATPMDARGPLRTTDGKDWPNAFASLAKETSCVLDASMPANTALVFDHLLSSAVALDYRDDADVLGAVVKTLKLGTAAKTQAPPGAKRQRVEPLAAADVQTRPTMENTGEPGLRGKLVELAMALDVDAEHVMRHGGGDHGGGVEALTKACACAVERFVAPFWDLVERAEKGSERASMGTKVGTNVDKNRLWNLDPKHDFPPGIELPEGTNDTVLASVAVLRVLHVNDMRRLQTAVDALLVQMQEHTSDPKTDAALGKVGKG